MHGVVCVCVCVGGGGGGRDRYLARACVAFEGHVAACKYAGDARFLDRSWALHPKPLQVALQPSHPGHITCRLKNEPASVIR